MGCRKLLYAIFLLMISVSSYSQKGEQLVTDGEFQEKLFNELLKDTINSVREKNNVPTLHFSEILDAAAFVQADYLLKENSMKHEQESSKYETLEKRVEYFEGRFESLGENIVLLPLSENTNQRRKSKYSIKTYKDAVSVAIDLWHNGKDEQENIYDSDYYRIGVSSIFKVETQELLIVLVLGSANYELPEGVRVQDDLGLKAYDKSICTKFLKEFPDLPELFSDAVKIQDGEVIFEVKNPAHMSKLIDKSSDAIAADIICKDQFPCDGGNKLFPGNVHDGYLLKPVKKSRISSLTTEDNKKFNLPLGSFPTFFNENNCVANIKIIKEDVVCETVPYNNFGGENISWLNLSPLIIKPFDSLKGFTWNDTITIKQHLGKKQKALDSILTYNNRIDPDIKGAKINLSLSPINKLSKAEKENIIQELRNLIHTYSKSKIGIEVKYFTNWDELLEFFQNMVYSLETKGMEKPKIVDYLIEESKEDKVLAKFLSSLDYLEIELYTQNSIEENLTNKELLKLYHQFVQQENTQAALLVQLEILNQDNGKKIVDEFTNIQLPRRKHFIHLLNNHFVTIQKYSDEGTYQGKTWSQIFTEIHQLDPQHKEVSYNLLRAKINEWSSNISNVTDVDEILKNIRILENSSVPIEDWQKLLLNYSILMADYHYEMGNFYEREKALGKVNSLLINKEFSESEANYYAEYYMFQLQIPWAIEILKPFALAENPSPQTLENILSISIYNNDILNKAEKLEIYKKLKHNEPESFCQLFTKEKMGFQQLKDDDIKNLYCETCKK